MEHLKYARFGPAAVMFALPDSDELPAENNRLSEIRSLRHQLAAVAQRGITPELAIERSRLESTLRSQSSQYRLEQVRLVEAALHELRAGQALADARQALKQVLSGLSEHYSGDWAEGLPSPVTLLVDALCRKALPLISGSPPLKVETSEFSQALKRPIAGFLPSEAAALLSLERSLSGFGADVQPAAGSPSPGQPTASQVAGSYQYQPRTPLQAPIHVFAGKGDSIGVEQLLDWQGETASGFSLDMFAGQHFFLHDQETQLLRCLRRYAEQHLLRWRATQARRPSLAAS